MCAFGISNTGITFSCVGFYFYRGKLPLSRTGHAACAWKATQASIVSDISCRSQSHSSADYVRAVAYAGGRLFSAGDDKTVRFFERRSNQTIVHAFPPCFASGSNVGNCASRLHTRADR